jgi:major membrane immunogen (membrane-anchored lipoprotein)
MFKKFNLCIIIVLSLLLVGCGKEKIKETDDLETKVDKVINNEAGKSYEREITLIDDAIYGGKIVSIDLDMRGSGRGTLLACAKKMFKNIFEFDGVSEVQIWYSGNLVDNNTGNEIKTSVMKIILKKETANSIGWERFDQHNFMDVADDYWEHKAFQK